MKKIGKLSLHDLSQAEIAKKEMNALKGGMMECRCECHCVVTCPCKYAGPQEGPNDPFYGGASATDNANARNIVHEEADSSNRNVRYILNPY